MSPPEIYELKKCGTADVTLKVCLALEPFLSVPLCSQDPTRRVAFLRHELPRGCYALLTVDQKTMEPASRGAPPKP